MTIRLAVPFTKAKLRRAIEVARETGSRVSVRPDGTIAFEGENDPQDPHGPLEPDGEIVL
jgi:hypothetical protein